MFVLKQDEFKENLKKANFNKDEPLKIRVGVYIGFFGVEVKLWNKDNSIIAPIEYKKTPNSEKTLSKGSIQNFYTEQANSGLNIANDIIKIAKENNYKVIKDNF